MNSQKVCRICKISKPPKDFRPMRKACRKCVYELGSSKVKEWRNKRHDYNLKWQRNYRDKHPLMRKLVMIRRDGISVKGLLEVLENMYLAKPFCEYCGIALNQTEVSLDHKTPISRGGSSNNPDNWALSCHDCNYLKRTRSYDEFQSFKIEYAKRLLADTERSQSHLERATVSGLPQ